MNREKFTTILDELGDSRITYSYGGIRGQSVFVNDDDLNIFIWHYVTEKVSPLIFMNELKDYDLETKEGVSLAIKKIRVLLKLLSIEWDFEK